MTECSIKISQQAWASTAGYALLTIIVAGLTGMFLQSVPGSDIATQNLLAHQTRYRTGLACEFLMLNNDILLAIALYGLLKPIDSSLALLGTLWRFANAIVLSIGVVAALTALELLSPTRHWMAFLPGQVQELATQFLQLHSVGSPIGLFFWSMGASIHSYLLLKSRYIPRSLSGAYLAVAVVIFFGCLAIMIFPAIDAVIDPWFVLPDLPVELAVSLWLIAKGASIPSPQPSPA